MGDFKKYDLPNSWQWSTIGEIGIVASGGTPSTKEPTYWGGDIPWVSPADLTGYNLKLISKGRKNITEEGLENSSAKLLPKGSVLFSSRAPIGYTVIAKNPISTNQGFKNLIPTDSLNSDYVYHYLKGAKHLAESMASGTTFLELSGQKFGQLPIPLAPLNEQLRIVAKIEELFSELDNGVENLKLAQNQLKVYRQALLKHAFEGKLTEEWRKENNPEPAEKLIERIKEERQARYEQELKDWKSAVKKWEKEGKKGKKPGKQKRIPEIGVPTADELNLLPQVPEGWQYIRINESVIDLNDDIVDGPFGSNLKNSDFTENGTVPVIGISNIDEGFDKKIRYVTEEKFETIKRSAVYPGNILVAKIGSSYGKSGIYPEWMPIGLIPANLLRINPAKHYSRNLLLHFLKGITFKLQLDKITKSTAQPAFNVTAFKNLLIPIMDVQEQNFLLDKIDEMISLIDNLESSIEDSLMKSELQRQSILKKAFEGKLVDQDPNDEPASELLKRIQEEKKKYLEEQKQQKKKAPKKTKKMKKTLSDTIEKNFKGKEFSYDELKEKSDLSYEEMKSQLYELIDSNEKFKSRFDQSKQEIKFSLSE